MGVRKWLEKSAEKQKYKLCKTLNPLSRKAFSRFRGQNRAPVETEMQKAIFVMWGDLKL